MNNLRTLGFFIACIIKCFKQQEQFSISCSNVEFVSEKVALYSSNK